MEETSYLSDLQCIWVEKITRLVSGTGPLIGTLNATLQLSKQGKELKDLHVPY
jgi:hypothetical protein